MQSCLTLQSILLTIGVLYWDKTGVFAFKWTKSDAAGLHILRSNTSSIRESFDQNYFSKMTKGSVKRDVNESENLNAVHVVGFRKGLLKPVATWNCPPDLKVDRVVHLSILLPGIEFESDQHNVVFHNKLELVRPAIELIANFNRTFFSSSYRSPLAEILPGWRVEVEASDTSCSSTIGPLEAFRLRCITGGRPCSSKLLHKKESNSLYVTLD